MQRIIVKALAICAVLLGGGAVPESAMAQGGTEVWRRMFPDSVPFPGNVQDDAVKTMYVNGAIVVAGTRTISTTSFFQVAKYNPTDGTNGVAYSGQWPPTSKQGIQRKVLAAAATVGGNLIPQVFLAGLVPSGTVSPYHLVQVVAFNIDTLQPTWTLQLSTGLLPSESTPVAIAADNERVAVTYATRISDDLTGINITTIVLDQTDGSVVYGPATFSSLGNQTDLPVGVVFDPHSPSTTRLYVAGTWPSAIAGHGLDYVALGYDYTSISLVPLWTTSIGDVNHNSTATAIAANAKNQSVYLTGNSSTFAGIIPTSDYLTVRLDSATGVEGWRAYYDGPAQKYDYATAIAAQWPGFTGEDALINYVYVTGYSRNAEGNDDMLTLRYRDQTTQYQQDWEGRFDRGVNGYDQGTALATHNGQPVEVFVAGVSQDSTGRWDYVSFKYNDDPPVFGLKDPSWIPVVFSGLPSGDNISASIVHVPGIGAPPNYFPNSVFVTGRGFGGSTGNDMFTIRADGP